MAPQLRVVKELSREDVIHHLNNGYKSLSDLERRSGIDRKILEGLQEEIDPKRQKRLRMPSRKKLNLLPADASPELDLVPPSPVIKTEPEPKPKPVGRTYSQIIWGVVAVWIGIVLGASGIIVNCQYWYAVGGSNHLVSMIFCCMGGTVDSITIAIPSWAAELWKRRNYGLSVIVAIFFLPVASVSIIASAGFSGTHIGDITQIRGDAKISKETLGKELDLKTAERNAIIKEVTDLPDVIEIQIQNERGRIPRDNLRWSKDCTDTTFSDPACRFLKQLRANKAKAERRFKLEAEIREQTTIYNAMPSISSKDPAAEHVSQMTFGLVRPEMVESYLINAMAAAPILAGLFFAIATALFR
jgi:hypothetical protein